MSLFDRFRNYNPVTRNVLVLFALCAVISIRRILRIGRTL